MARRFNHPEDAKLLGCRIRAARKKQGRTLAALGNEIGVHHAQISRIERGEAATVSRNVIKICKYLNISSDIDNISGESLASLEERIERLVHSYPACEKLLRRFIDSLEEVVRNELGPE